MAAVGEDIIPSPRSDGHRLQSWGLQMVLLISAAASVITADRSLTLALSPSTLLLYASCLPSLCLSPDSALILLLTVSSPLP